MVEVNNRILILGNNPIEAEKLVEILGKIEMEAKILYSSKVLFNVVEESNFDLIFIDNSIPFINWNEFLKALSKNPISQNIPIIFLNITSETKNIIEKIELGCYDYINKPYEIDELKAKIENIIKLKQLQDDRDCFIETLTHDLKTPVRSEIRAIELLLNGHFGVLNSNQLEVLEEILNSSNYMFFMLDSILSKHKFDKNKIKLLPTEFSINELIRQCIKEVRILFETKKQNIIICFENKQEQIEADYMAIKRIIINLLSNATKFSPEGSNIEIIVSEYQDEIKIEIIDNGIGIPNEDLKNIFEYKTKNKKRFKQVGAGLGLYISKKIIEMHGGNIVAESNQGKGSNFKISLPKNSFEVKKEFAFAK